MLLGRYFYSSKNDNNSQNLNVLLIYKYKYMHNKLDMPVPNNIGNFTFMTHFSVCVIVGGGEGPSWN